MFDISVTDRCHKILAKYISEGDTVIDCTAGGGSDTLFLAKCVGSDGRVLAFDVQEAALNATENRICSIDSYYLNKNNTSYYNMINGYKDIIDNYYKL